MSDDPPERFRRPTPASDPSNAESGPAGATEPSAADLFTVLAHRHRRLVLSRLLNAGTSITVDDLAGYVARREHATDPSASAEERRLQAEVGLRHTHLPLLADLGFVEYDRGRSSDRVSPNAVAAVAEKYIHRAAQDEHFRLAGRDR